MQCRHPAHRLSDIHALMLETAVTTVQQALWSEHAPTVFGNSPSAEKIAKSLGKELGEYHIHHAPDGCWTVHYTYRAEQWHTHLNECTPRQETTMSDDRTEAQKFADNIVNAVNNPPAIPDPTPQQIASDVQQIDNAFKDSK